MAAYTPAAAKLSDLHIELCLGKDSTGQFTETTVSAVSIEAVIKRHSIKPRRSNFHDKP